jgi:DNA-binding transcriptional regulator/RsmH inhibitor MraZ
MLIGVQDHLELWQPERWEVYLAEKQARYDEIAENAFRAPKS